MSKFAAIDRHAPNSGAVYGLGSTAEEALQDARSHIPDGEFSVVPCTDAAAVRVLEYGGAPNAGMIVTSSGVFLRSEET